MFKNGIMADERTEIRHDEIARRAARSRHRTEAARNTQTGAEPNGSFAQSRTNAPLRPGSVANVEQAQQRPRRRAGGAGAAAPAEARPRLLFFYGRTNGLSRRVEGYLAQVLQRHRNHSTFQLIRVAVEEHTQLADHFQVRQLPTLIVIDGEREKTRIEAPRDRASIEQALSPWLL